MNAARHPDLAVSRIAAAIGEPARLRMLYSLLDGHARTSTELAIVAEITPATASVHLSRLRAAHLVRMIIQGRCRYYSLEGPNVANALEGLSVLAGGPLHEFVPNTPVRLRFARTCYDHMAGTVGVLLHDRLKVLGWLLTGDHAYELTQDGVKALEVLGIDLAATRSLRRKFAYPCLDWSERRPHIGGALGVALLKIALKRKWVEQELDSRSLTITSRGCRELMDRLGVQLPLIEAARLS